MLRGRFTSAAVLRCTAVPAAAAAVSSVSVASVSRVSAQQTPAVCVAAVQMQPMRFNNTTSTGQRVDPDGAKKTGAYLLDRADVLSRVTEVVKNFEKVDAEKVTAESHFINDLGLDSLDVVEVVMALEQEFVLDIPDHEAEKIQSIPDAVDYLASNPMAK